MRSAQILLVDDDSLILAALSAGLRGAGYRVLQAESGSEALAQASRQPGDIDLAILDINMPSMSGIELADQLIQQHNIPALFLSAHADDDIVEDATAKGAMGYLVKPVAIAQLIPSVEAALARAKDFNAMLKVQGQLEKAMLGRRNTSICVGIIMERQRLSEQQAFNALRNQARARQQRLEDMATEIVGALEMVNQAGK